MPADRTEKLLYVYALTDGGRSGRLRSGVRGLRTIEVDGITAIVEAVRAARSASEETLFEQHATVVRLARRFEALLPVRFGAVFTRAELEARIESSHVAIRRALDTVRHRVQMTVRLHGRAPAALPRDVSGTAWLIARADRLRLLERNAARLRRAVARVVDDERIDPGKGALQGTVYHLIRLANVERYRAAIAEVAPAVAPTRVMVTGPWPVFAFVPELDRAPRAQRKR